MTYGYIRVSSIDQNEARQLDAMDNAGISRECLFIDKKSGKDFNRPAWKRLMRTLKRGDLLVVQSLDRLGRDYDEILIEWRKIVKVKGVNIRVLDMSVLDTRINTKELAERFVMDLVLQVQSFVAENERRNIKERQRQGIAAAKARGVRFGRPRVGDDGQVAKCLDAIRSGNLSRMDAAEICHVSLTTIRRRLGKPEVSSHRQESEDKTQSPTSSGESGVCREVG